jgi:hypothetical protein
MEGVLFAAYVAVSRQNSVNGEQLNLILEFLHVLSVIIKGVHVKNNLYILFSHLYLIGDGVVAAAESAL